MEIIPQTFWKDQKGRIICIQSMSSKWLNNIRKKIFATSTDIQPILDEIKRRKEKK